MAALAAGHGDLEQHDLGGQVQAVALDGEARQPVDRLADVGRVVGVQPAVVGEVRVEGQALQTVLVAAVDVQLRGDRRGAGAGVVHPDGALAGGGEDPAVGGHGQAHRLAEVAGEQDLVEVLPLRPAAVAAGQARGVPDAPEQVVEEQRLAVGRRGVPAAGVPGAPAVVLVAPRGRVVGAHRPGTGVVAGLVEGREDVDVAPGVGPVVVPLVEALPAGGQVRGRRVGAVADLDRRGLVRGVALEVRADQVAVPGPVVLGVRGGVDAGEPAAVGDEALERGLLAGVQHVAGGGQEHHGLVAVEPRVGEGAGVLGGGDGEPVVLAQLLDGGDARGDGVVPEARGLGEDQDVGGGGLRGGGPGGRERRRHRDCEKSTEQHTSAHGAPTGDYSIDNRSFATWRVTRQAARTCSGIDPEHVRSSGATSCRRPAR